MQIAPGPSENRLMNRRVWCCVGLLSVIAWFDRSSLAQPAPVPGAAAGPVIPLGAQNAPNAAQFQPIIHQFVVAQFAALSAPATRGAARKQLIAACPKGVSESFAAIYGKEVNLQAAATLAAVQPMPIRLNVAIVLYYVASNGDTIEVEPEVRALLDDRDASVAYWAVKASEPLVKVLTKNQQVPGSKLIPAIIACSEKHAGTDSLSGDIAEDAYLALTPSEIAGVNPAQMKILSIPLIDPVLDLMEFRTQLYATEMVSNPGAERTPAKFLSANFSAMNPNQQHRTVQDLVNLVTDLGIRAADYEQAQKAAPKGKADQMSLIRNAIKISASALDVVCGTPAISSELNWLVRIPPSATAAEIVAHTSRVFGTVQNADPFKTIVAPPALPALAVPAAPAPATAPAPAV
jgi:hypothetical protein